MTQQSVWIPTRDGKKLEGLVRKPEGKGPFPTVIFVVGLGMTLHEWKGTFDEIASTLVEAGFLTVQFAFDIFQHDGRVLELPVFARARFVEDVLQWARQLPDVDAGRVGILAQSYGVATVTAANLVNIQSVIWVSGVYLPYENFIKIWPIHGTILNFNGETIRHHADGTNTTVGKEFWTEMKSFNQLALAAKMKMPVFMIHGDQDKYFIKDQVEKVYSAIPNDKKRQKIFVGGDHGINEVPRPMREEFLRDVVQWYTETLRR
jgi:dienelactone hydrolase